MISLTFVNYRDPNSHILISEEQECFFMFVICILIEDHAVDFTVNSITPMLIIPVSISTTAMNISYSSLILTFLVLTTSRIIAGC